LLKERPDQGVKLLGLLLAESTGQHMAGRNGLASYTLASKGLGWAGGSQFEFGRIDFQFAVEA
jgi:hypothetical protein